MFELEVVPVAIGLGIYVSCRLLLWALAPRPQKSKELQELQEAALPEKGTELSDDDQQEPEPMPESAKDAKAAGSAPGRRVMILLLPVMAVALALLSATLPLQSPRSDVLQQQAGVSDRLQEGSPGSAQELQATGYEQDRGAVIFSSELPEPPSAEEATGYGQGCGAAIFGPELPELSPSEEEEDHGDNDPAFNVKLTRQIMNDAKYVRSAYYGTLEVGQPAVSMTVVFDTGSGNLVLPSMYCRSETCKQHTRYRRSASTTAVDIFEDGSVWSSGPRESVTVSFGTGEITGVFVEDVVCISDISNLSSWLLETDWGLPPGCTTLRFLAATDLSEDPFKGFHFDGILGLGLSGLSQTPRFNFMEVLAQTMGNFNPSRHTQKFAVFLANHENEESDIALGGWSKKHLQEDLSWSPVLDPEMGHWIIPIRGIRVGSDRLNICDDGRCRAAVDTGTSLLAVPSDAFREMYLHLRHAAPTAGHCRGYGPLLHFELDRFTVSLGPRDIGQVRRTHTAHMAAQKENLYEGKGSGRRPDLRCVPMLMTLDMEEMGPKLFILGEPVLRKYYSVFDSRARRVGLARAKHMRYRSRSELLEEAAEVDPVARRRMPTMFDIFRWQSQLQ